MVWGAKGNSFEDARKRKRQEEQNMFKDAKNHRESEYFWQKQRMLGSSPPHAKHGWKLQQEEKELFGDMHDGSVGIDFDKYDDIPVDLSGQGADQIVAVSDFTELFAHYQIPSFL